MYILLNINLEYNNCLTTNTVRILRIYIGYIVLDMNIPLNLNINISI